MGFRLRRQTAEYFQSNSGLFELLSRPLKFMTEKQRFSFTEAVLFESENSSELQNVGVLGFPGGAVVENLPANAGDTGSSPGLGRSHMPRSN